MRIIISLLVASAVLCSCNHRVRTHEGGLMEDRYDDEVRELVKRPEVTAITGENPKLSFAGSAVQVSTVTKKYRGWEFWRKLGNSSHSSGTFTRNYALTGEKANGGLTAVWIQDDNDVTMTGWRVMGEADFQKYLSEQATRAGS